jgi:hypothetical protein
LTHSNITSEVLLTTGLNLGTGGYANRGKQKRQTKKSKFRITGYLGGREYSGLKDRKRYYREPYHLQNVTERGNNGKSVWFNFVEKELVEDCPHCNPELSYLYRINQSHEPFVSTNFAMTTEVAPTKKKVNYLKAKQNMKKVFNNPKYDHHDHKLNRSKHQDVDLTRSSYSMTPEKQPGYLEKYGSSLANKFKLVSHKKPKISSSNLTQKKKDPRVYRKSRFGQTATSSKRSRSPLYRSNL